MSRKPRIPSYRLHKPTGQAVVTLGGHDHYLGLHNTQESQAEYRRLLGEWMGSGQASTSEPAPLSLSVDEIINRYRKHAEVYYPRGDTTSQMVRINSALRFVHQLYGATEARRFGPAALRAVRNAMIEQGYARKLINAKVGCIRRAFTWAASHELIPGSVPQALDTIEGLRAGRSAAPESEPIEPVPEADIEPVRQLVLPTVRDLIDLQLLTATRPGEILRLQDCDIDRSGSIWVVKKRKHKNAWRGQERTILIGPRGQEIVARRLDPTRQGPYYLFSALAAVEAKYREIGWEGRLKLRRKRRPGEYYKGSSYSNAIARACAKAGITPWHPHQLRHNAATRLVAEFGWDVARIVLGQRSLDATRIYAADDMGKAVEAMKKIG